MCVGIFWDDACVERADSAQTRRRRPISSARRAASASLHIEGNISDFTCSMMRRLRSELLLRRGCRVQLIFNTFRYGQRAGMCENRTGGSECSMSSKGRTRWRACICFTAAKVLWAGFMVFTTGWSRHRPVRHEDAGAPCNSRSISA